MLRLAVWSHETVRTDAILKCVHYSRRGKEERVKMTLTDSTVTYKPLEPGWVSGIRFGSAHIGENTES